MYTLFKTVLSFKEKFLFNIVNPKEQFVFNVLILWIIYYLFKSHSFKNVNINE